MCQYEHVHSHDVDLTMNNDCAFATQITADFVPSDITDRSSTMATQQCISARYYGLSLASLCNEYLC